MKTEEFHGHWCALEACWRETRQGWNDPVAWRFEREFWEPLNQAANEMLRETEALFDQLEAVRARVNH